MQAISLSPCVEVQKAQMVRVADVALLGPFMIAFAVWDRPPPWARSAMVIAGIGTIGYNLRNYMATQDLRGLS